MTHFVDFGMEDKTLQTSQPWEFGGNEGWDFNHRQYIEVPSRLFLLQTKPDKKENHDHL